MARFLSIPEALRNRARGRDAAPPPVAPRKVTRKDVREHLASLDFDTVGTPMRAAIARAFEALWQPQGQPAPLPPEPVLRVIRDQFHRLYYHASDRTWKRTHYRGVLTYKCPTDMWMYQELIDRIRPGLIVETGTFRGGSALFLADRLQLLGRGRVISIDVDVQPKRPVHPRLSYIEGSSTAPEVLDLVRDAIDPALPVLVILDSDHSEDHVARELELYSPLITEGSYLIVEDTNVNGHPAAPLHGPGPFEAATAFMADNDDFAVDTSCERYFLTQNPSGFLRRVTPHQPPSVLALDEGQRLSSGLERDAASPALDVLERLVRNDAVPGQSPRVVLVLDTYQVGGYFAGVKTAVVASGHLARELARPLEVLVVQTPGHASRQDTAAEIADMLVAAGLADVAGSVTFSVPGRREATYGSAEVWVATYWTTAWALKSLCDGGALAREQVVYLIQDFEPAFFAWGPQYIKALSTYEAGFSPLVNSAPLAAALAKETGSTRWKAFAPDLDGAPLAKAAAAWTPASDGTLRVLCYARPSKPRNMYPLLIETLRLWLRDRPSDAQPVVVRLAGEDIAEDVDLGLDVSVEILGKLTYQGYYDVLAQSDLGLALMLSPHPGHLALELPMAGIPTVTNRFAQHRSAWVPGLIVAAPDPRSIAAALEDAATLARGLRSHQAQDVPTSLGPPLPEAVATLARGLAGHGPA